jgi:hypothetical protein
MADQTKSEIIVVGAAAAFLLYLWSRNARATSAPAAPINLPALGDNTFPLLGAPMFNVGAGTPGETLSYQGGDVSLPGRPSLPFNNNALAFTTPVGMPHSCSSCSNANLENTFGSNADLTAWLTSQPSLAQAAADANKWY